MGRPKKSDELPKLRPLPPPGARRLNPVPYNMDSIEVSEDQRRVLFDLSMSIFTDCANSGVPFAECIQAVYLSGLHHGAETVREQKRKTPMQSIEEFFDKEIKDGNTS